MPELSIRFTSDETTINSPIQVMLFRPDTGVSTDPVPFNPPLDDPELGELRWYLETYALWPTGPDYERAEHIEAQLENWGRALRQSILADADAGQLWQQFISSDDNACLLTIDATDPRVLRLPWELLADEGGTSSAPGLACAAACAKRQPPPRSKNHSSHPCACWRLSHARRRRVSSIRAPSPAR